MVRQRVGTKRPQESRQKESQAVREMGEDMRMEKERLKGKEKPRKKGGLEGKQVSERQEKGGYEEEVEGSRERETMQKARCRGSEAEVRRKQADREET